MEEHQPDLVLLADIVNGESSVPLATTIRTRSSPASRMIIIGSRIDEDELATYLTLGIAGYLIWRDVTRETLASYLSLLAQGATIYSPSVAPVVTRLERGDREMAGDSVQLTKREDEVLKLLCQGKASKEIVNALGISESTVKRNVAALKHKPNASSLFELGAAAARLQLC